MRGAVVRRAEKAPLRKVRFKVSNEPKASERWAECPRQTEGPSCAKTGAGRRLAGSKNLNSATLLFC